MSPAGLKAIAEEAGLEMVIICANNMGDIFRRNAFNLGLHVVQSPEAVADARDGDEFTFDPVSRRIANVTQGKTYTPVPLSAKEDEIRQSGGIFALGRREFRASAERTPAIVFPDADRARRMSSTAQIVWAHRVDKDAEVTPGATLRVFADLLPASDGTAPFSIHTFNQITGGNTIFPRQAAVANDHFVFTGKQDDDKQTAIGRRFIRSRNRITRRRATASFISTFPSRAWSCPVSSFPAPIRTAAPTARMARSAWVWDRRRSGSGGRPVTSTSRWRRSAASRFAAGSVPGSPARTSCSSCCAAGAPNSRRACRWNWWTPTSSCRSRFATPSPT
jgi:hypothetical protein